MAEMVGQKIREGTVLCLEGDLGVGKTLFVQSLAHTLGVEGEVTSPTFNLMNVYEGICPIYHFDLYRLETEEELEDIGFYDALEGDGPRGERRTISCTSGRAVNRSLLRLTERRIVSCAFGRAANRSLLRQPGRSIGFCPLS